MPTFLRRPSRIALASGTLITGTVGFSSAALAGPNTLDCGPNATQISPSVCEANFTTTGTSTWTPPANAASVEALLVGGGGDGAPGLFNAGYGGEGGQVKVVTLSNTGEVTVSVGLDAVASSVAQGSNTQEAKAGKNGSESPTTNGYGSDFDGAGAGAGGSASNRTAGTGVVVNSIVSAGSLFSGDNDCFGGGGAAISYNYNGNLPVGQQYEWFPGTSTCGGGTVSETNDVVTLSDAAAGQGGGGSANFITGVGAHGGSGRVTIRFTLTTPSTSTTTTTTQPTTLPHTGSNVRSLLSLGSLLVMCGSLVALVGRRRTKA